MLKGAITAIITPFYKGRVDEDDLRSLLEFQLANGVTGIVPCGTTGESATLNHHEHKRVVEITIETVNKRVPVIAGAGSNNTAEAISLTQFAKDAGADAALHITPYYNKPTQDGLFRHFEAIAQATHFPLVPYNIPGRSGVNILPDTMSRIADIPEVIAVKEATGDLGQMAEAFRLCGDRMDLLSGDDGLLLPILAIGGKGIISVVSNLLPRAVADICSAWEQGQVAKARELFYKLLPICKAMFVETNPIPIKTSMAHLGIIKSAEMRLPMCPLQPASWEKIKAVLTAYGLEG